VSSSISACRLRSELESTSEWKVVCKATGNSGIKTLTSPFSIYLRVLCHYLLTAAASPFTGCVQTGGPLFFHSVSQNENVVLGIEEGQEIQPFVSCTYTQNLHMPTQTASAMCLYLNLKLNSWIQQPSLCLSAPLHGLQHYMVSSFGRSPS